MRGECPGLGCPYENEYWHLALNALRSLERAGMCWGKNEKKKKAQGHERKAHWFCLLCVLKAFVYIGMQIYEILKMLHFYQFLP